MGIDILSRVQSERCYHMREDVEFQTGTKEALKLCFTSEKSYEFMNNLH
jgi:hypothetical protein